MKRRGLILILIISLLLVGSVASAQTMNDVRAAPKFVPGELSGGEYVLTIQSTALTQPTGYRLLDSAPAADPASGCCCKGYLPCVMK